MKVFCTMLVTGTLLGVSIPAAALLLGEAEDGKPLHDNFCSACHVNMFGGDGSSIYTRDTRRVQSIEGLMGQVAFCNQQTSAGLNEHEVDDIIAYLNETFYGFETD
ncbi:MAG TPA: cytochrome c [Arenicellales bacterium]|nr:cytochrome c [Arenicellales bacterium]HJL56017.1 cytochrome c [Arenicellales bacterium]